MDYNNRFTNKKVQINNYKTENDMLDFINKNLVIIEVLQVYTSIDPGYWNEIRYHLMYKFNMEEKVMI